MKFSLEHLFGAHDDPAAKAAAQRLAVAQLLFEIARADLDTDAREIQAIRSHLAQAYQLGAAELDALIADARARVEKSVSLYDSVKVLNDALSPEEKTGLIAALWRVAYADGHLDPYEESLLRKLSELLYIPHETFIREKLALLNH